MQNSKGDNSTKEFSPFYNSPYLYYTSRNSSADVCIQANNMQTPTAYLFNYCSGIAEKYKQEGNRDKHALYLKNMLILFEFDNNQNSTLVLNLFNDIANLYEKSGNLNEACYYLIKLLRYNDLGMIARDVHIIPLTHKKIAIIYQELNDYENALKHFQLALEVGEENFSHDPDWAIYCYTKLADLCESQKNYQNAIYNLKEVLKLGKELDTTSSEWIAHYHIKIGHLYKEISPSLAILYFQKALNSKNNFVSVDSEELSSLNINIAHIYIKIKHPKKAIPYFKKALEINEVVFSEFKHQAIDLYKSLRFTYDIMGKEQEAWEYVIKSCFTSRKLGIDPDPDDIKRYDTIPKEVQEKVETEIILFLHKHNMLENSNKNGLSAKSTEIEEAFAENIQDHYGNISKEEELIGVDADNDNPLCIIS